MRHSIEVYWVSIEWGFKPSDVAEWDRFEVEGAAAFLRLRNLDLDRKTKQASKAAPKPSKHKTRTHVANTPRHI